MHVIAWLLVCGFVIWYTAHPGERANVVFVSMGDDDSLDLVTPLGQEADVG